MQTETEKTNSEEPNEEAAIVEGSGGEESKHQSQSVEEILTEVLNTNKITEETQTEHISEYIIDPEDDTTVEQDEQVDSPIQEPDISSDQDDATTEPNDLNGVAEDTAAAPKTGEENGIDKIFKAIQKITHSHTDLSGEHTTGKIYEAIQKMTQSPADLPGQPPSLGAEPRTLETTRPFGSAYTNVSTRQTFSGRLSSAARIRVGVVRPASRSEAPTPDGSSPRSNRATTMITTSCVDRTRSMSR